MSANTLDLQAVRDWHARDQGWTWNPWVEGDAIWERGDVAQYEHPIPCTLDAADACMPEGWDWTRSLYDCGWGWMAFKCDGFEMDGEHFVDMDSTFKNKTIDLFNLARLCRIAEGATP